MRTINRFRVISLLAACVALSAASALFAAPKIPASAWETGTLRNVASDTRSRLVGIYGNGQGMMAEHIRIVTHYTIDAGRYIYDADRTTKRHDKLLDVTINAPVKFAVVGMDLYLQDDAGKIHKLEIVTKTLKEQNGNEK